MCSIETSILASAIRDLRPGLPGQGYNPRAVASRASFGSFAGSATSPERPAPATRERPAIERALEGADAVYVALDCDSVEPGELEVFMPEPEGLSLTELEELLRDVAARTRIAGLGFTGLVRDPVNEPKLARLATALGL